MWPTDPGHNPLSLIALDMATGRLQCCNHLGPTPWGLNCAMLHSVGSYIYSMYRSLWASMCCKLVWSQHCSPNGYIKSLRMMARKLLGMLIVGWLFWTITHANTWLVTSNCHFNATFHSSRASSHIQLVQNNHPTIMKYDLHILVKCSHKQIASMALGAYNVFAVNFTVVLVSQQTDCC